MRYLRALASALTIFAGHFLNRRLDRVVQFCAALALTIILSYVALTIVVSRMMADGSSTFGTPPFGPMSVAIAAIAIVSAVLTWFDASSAAEARLSMPTRVAGVIVSACGLLLIGITVWTFLASLPSRTFVPSESHAVDIGPAGEEFHAFVQFGGNARGFDLPPPPTGPHALRGRITLHGEPIAGAQISLYLNEEFEVGPLRADANGEIEAHLPKGVWFLNQLRVTGRHAAAVGRQLTAITGLEPRKGAGIYSKFDYNRSAGHEIRLPLNPDALAFTVDLRDAIETDWPPRTDVFRVMQDDIEAAEATIDASIVRWRPVPKAVEYEVQINRLEKSERGFSSSTVTTRRLDDTALPLSSLPQRTADLSSSERYSIEIFAFDAEGRLVNEADTSPLGAVFRLDGAAQLSKEHASPYSGPSTREPRSSYFRDLERLSLVSSLLEYKQLDAAKAILDQVSGEAPPGRKTALQAAIAALSGDCATAIPLFDRAESEGGVGCVAPRHRALCAP